MACIDISDCSLDYSLGAASLAVACGLALPVQCLPASTGLIAAAAAASYMKANTKE